MSGQSFSVWAEICKKRILSTQLGISAAVEGCLLENLPVKEDVSASAIWYQHGLEEKGMHAMHAFHLDRPSLIIEGCLLKN